ncbi:MAG: exopolysaccharide biosynthesis polyprenyl glycosylphosphotransferase [Candidatus Nealsonbacteria bacterium]|nr:exopolysaccharide biosynthesis polyprenyl glycosylphosphotransferase [Candidatus Nealsonbacteria bacterium]
MKNRKRFFKFILLTGDIILIYSALFLALRVRYGDFSFWISTQIKVILFHFSFIFFFWFIFLYILDFYEIPPLKKVFDFFRNLLIFIFSAGALGAVYFYIRPETLITPRITLFLNALIFSVLFCGWRYIFSHILKLKNFREKIAVIGFKPGLEEVIDNQILSRAGYEISVFFNPETFSLEKFSHFLSLAKYGVVFDIKELREIIKKERIGTVVFPRFLTGNEKIIQQIFSNLPLRMNYVSLAAFYEIIKKKVSLEVIDEIWFLENLARSERGVGEILKRGFDILFSVAGLLAVAVLFPFISLAIKLDSPGNIFYSQKRVGKDGKQFTLYKFRSMKESPDQNRCPWREKDQSQITKVGRFLRRTHLDEIPQFWSILKGDLSFVGPRPEWAILAKDFEKEIPFYRQRCLVRPGFTGWAQLHYLASTSVEEAREKFQYDLYYIKNRNLFLDLGIILKTIRIIFK